MTDMFAKLGDVTETIVNRWTWWQSALKGNFGPMHSEPEQGYFRTKKKNGPWEPVAIWWDDEVNGWVAYRNGRETDAHDIWTWCCRNPISHEAYEKAIAGEGFDDEPKEASVPKDHNSSEADPMEALRIEYLGEKEQAEAFMKKPVTTQAEADKVAIWAKRLTAIKTRAEGLHKVEKQPHLDAGRDVDDKWRELKTEPDELSKRLKAHIKSFLQEQIRAEENRQREARAEADRIRRAADEAHIAAEAATAKQIGDGLSDAAAIKEHNDRVIAAERLDEQARNAEQEAEARKVNAGRTGARVSMRTDSVGVVTDYAKAAAALVAMKHKDLLTEIDRLAQRAAKAGMPFDGMEIRQEEKVV